MSLRSIESSSASYTPSWDFANSTLSMPRLSSDQSIIIEPMIPSAIKTSSRENSVELVLLSTKVHYLLLKDVHWFCISGFLSPEEVVHVSSTCKSLKQILDKPIVWKNQNEIQDYEPIYPVMKESLQGSDHSKFSSQIINMIIEYGWDYKAVFAEPIPNEMGPGFFKAFSNTHILHPIPRPPIMRRENNKFDPDFPGKKNKETHIWACGTWFEVNGCQTSLSTNVLEELVQNSLERHLGKFDCYSTACHLSSKQKKTPMGNPGWYLISMTIRKGTENIPFDRQVEVIKEQGYEPPSFSDIILPAMLWPIMKREQPLFIPPVVKPPLPPFGWRWVQNTYTNTTTIGQYAAGNHIVVGRGYVAHPYDGDLNTSIGMCGLRRFS